MWSVSKNGIGCESAKRWWSYEKPRNTRGHGLEMASLSTNPRFLALIERSQKQHEIEGGISHEEMSSRLLLPSESLTRRSSRRRQKARGPA